MKCKEMRVDGSGNHKSWCQSNIAVKDCKNEVKPSCVEFAGAAERGK